MKKINLNQLSMSWNEKQMPQKFRRYAGMLIMLLTLGVGQMWATDLYVRGYSSWDGVTANKMSGTSSPWTFTAYWSTNGEFKIGTNDWSINLGSANIAAWGTKYNLTSNGNNMSFPSLATGGGIYTITVTLESSTYKIKVDKVTEEQSTWRQISAPKIYWDNTSANYTNVTMINGRYTNYGSDGKGTLASSLTQISNTNLWYNVSMDNGNGDGSQFTSTLFVDADWDGWENNNVPTERAMYATSNTAVNTAALNSNTFLFSGANGNRGATLSRSQLASGYSDLNKTQTIQVRISEDNGSSYTNAANFAAWPGSITVARTYLSSATASSTPDAAAMEATTTTGALTSSITFTGASTTEYTFAGWSNTNSSPDGKTAKTYTITDASTKYAFYKRKQYTVSYGVNSSTRWGSITLNSGSAVTTTGSSTLNHGTSLSFTASPNTNYQVEGWYSDAACSAVNRLQSGGTSYDAGTLTAAKTVYVKFEEKTGGVITINAGSNGQISKDNSNWASSATYTSITTTDALNIYARGNTGYEFSSWAKSSGQGTITSTSSASTTFTPVAYEDATVTASFSEIMSSLSTSCSYDAGDPSYAAPTKSTSSIGISTTADLSATAPSTGYTFVGWTLTHCVRTSGEANSRNITVRSDGSGEAASAVANYEEDLTSSWKILGGTNLTGDDWDEHAMTKKSGHSTEDIVYYTFNISSTNSGISGTANDWSFKIKNGDTWYGLSADGDSWWYQRNSGQQTLSTSGKNIQLCADVAGSYEIKVDYTTPASPKVTVTFPTSYTLTYSIGSVAGTSGSISTSPTTASGSKVLSGNSVTLTGPAAKTGYTWKGWYTNAAGTEGKIPDTDRAITVTMNADKTLYACYTENSYSTNVAVSPAGYGTISSPAPSAGKIDVSHHTGTAVTAASSNAKYYIFKNWSVADGGLTVNSTTANPATFKATEAGGTITANFTPKWHIVGGDSDAADGEDAMGNWNKYANGILNFGVVSSQDTGYVNIDLPANSTFKFKVVDLSDSETWYGNTGTMNYADNNKQEWTMSSEESTNCGIITAGKGTYKFSWNMNTKKVRVAYPVSYKANFSVGTVPGTDGTPTAETSEEIAFTTGQYVTTGTSVTFTAPAAKSGYTWRGWYTTPNTSGTKLSTDDELTYTTTITATNTVYAVYTEDMHTVTLTSGAHGTAHVTDDVATSGSAGIATGLNITATPDAGFFFSSWEKVSGDATIANVKSASTTVTATSDATIRATFVGEWVLAGIGDWDPTAHGFGDKETVEGKELCYMNLDLEANTRYTFKVVQLVLEGDNVWYGNNTTTQYMDYAHNNGQYWQFETGGDKANCGLETAGKGTYQFVWNITDKQLKINFPESHTVTYGVKTWKGVDGATAKETSTTGGSISSVKDPDDISLTSGKYVIDEGVVTFTHSDAATNYHFDGWYSDGECTTPYVDDDDVVEIDDEAGTLALTVSDDVEVYAKFAENMTTVTLAHTGNGHVEIGGEPVTSTTAGVVTTRSITAVPDAGYYFSGWTVEPAEGADYSVSGTGEANTTITLRGLGAGETTGQTLTANFVEENKIYFRNIFDDGEGNVSRWSDVYAYFDYSWDGTKVKTNSNSAYRAQMTQIEGTDVYWAYVPRAFTNSGQKTVAFSDTEFAANYTFYNATASGSNGSARGDYNNALNMFVPHHTKNKTNDNGVDYYDNGYWMRYDTKASQGAGYYFKIYNSKNNYTQEGEFIATNDNATFIQYKHRVDNTDASKTRFMFTSAGALNYIASATIDGTNALSNINVYENLLDPKDNDIYFQLTATSEGYYTFILDQSSDVMKITVIYPVSPGDYQLVYTYNSGADTHASDVIKADNASSTVARNVSMYIDPTVGANTLKLQKCTSINETTKLPEWTSGVSVGTLSDYFKVDNTATKGVYVFDLTIVDGNAVSADVTSATVSDATIYDGEFYIKTDYAPGGWVNYTQNVMDENTINYDKDKPETFDYYFCKWIEEGEKNVKCVIANEYSQQITDTLIGDDILGIDASTSKPREYLAYAANVRFSYNSYTNELKRAYINGATDWQKTFLCLSAGSAVITDTDGDAFEGNSTTFVDQNNWIYMVDIKAYEQARVKLTANYRFNGNDHIQYLIGKDGEYSNANTQEILGGATPANSHTIRVIYDFKTNKLISAWLADDGSVVGERAINTDVLVIRTGQGDPTQITFADASSQLTEVDTVYSALCLTKDYLNNSSLSDSERRYYWVSFPYDVRISDIFGSFGEYGEYWIFQRYNGRKRAQYGFWAESSSNWEYITDKSDTLNAYEGYVLTLDLDEFNSSNMKFWGNSVTQIYEYFPSMSKQSSIEYAATKAIGIDQEGYQCTIDRSHEVHNGRELGPEYDRRVRDSYWHLIGVPSYAQTSGNAFHNAESGEGWISDRMPFFYSWNMSTNKLSAASTTTSDPFMPMRAYLVQYSGTTITWNAVSASPSSIVARRQAAEDIQFAEFNLHLMSGEESLDHTYVRLTDDEEASADFEFGHDLCKEFHSGANIYTIIDQLEVAGNSLPLSDQTTIVPVGVKIASNGEYTFAMPEGTNGVGVIIVDNATGTRTNLGLTDYTVNLTSGKIDNRFWLEISPVQDAPTGIETVSGDGLEMRGARKVMIDGLLYIVKDGKIFDAQGRNIQ